MKHKCHHCDRVVSKEANAACVYDWTGIDNVYVKKIDLFFSKDLLITYYS